MTSYHINPETGEPGKCRALIKCRFGDAEHYDTEESARVAFETKMSKQSTFLVPVNKETSVEVDQLSLAEELKQLKQSNSNLEVELSQVKAERDGYFQRMEEVNIVRQQNEVRAILAEDRFSELENEVLDLRAQLDVLENPSEPPYENPSRRSPWLI
jgi:hypothetical protein